MPTMVTFQAGRAALLTLFACLAAACTREQQDWRSAEAANSPEGWQRFLEQHPASELAGQARARVTQLETQRDFQHADRVGTVDAYRDFLVHHPSGEWSERARIRIESFSLGSAPRIGPPTPDEATAYSRAAVRALRLATAEGRADAATGASVGAASAQPDVGQPAAARVGADDAAVGPIPPATTEGAVDQVGAGRAVPGEAAQAPAEAVIKPAAAIDVPSQSGYGVQLGAFGSEASADREWHRLRGRFGAELGNLSPRIVLAETDSGELYRLQAPAAGEAEARAICDSLHEQSQACIAVPSR
jgi:SPOR domain